MSFFNFYSVSAVGRGSFSRRMAEGNLFLGRGDRGIVNRVEWPARGFRGGGVGSVVVGTGQGEGMDLGGYGASIGRRYAVLCLCC